MRMNERERQTRLALRRQRDVLCDVMLSAGECGTWLTLKELSKMTRYGEASISAQLRHLRKQQYGGFVVDKRRREDQEVGRSSKQGALWEYRLQRGTRLIEGAVLSCLPVTAGSQAESFAATAPV